MIFNINLCLDGIKMFLKMLRDSQILMKYLFVFEFLFFDVWYVKDEYFMKFR